MDMELELSSVAHLHCCSGFQRTQTPVSAWLSHIDPVWPVLQRISLLLITDMVSLAQVEASDFYLQGRAQVMVDDAKEDALTVHIWKCLTMCCS